MTPTPTPRDLLLLGKLEEAADAALATTKRHTAEGRTSLLAASARLHLVTTGEKGRANVERFIGYCERLNAAMAT